MVPDRTVGVRQGSGLDRRDTAPPLPPPCSRAGCKLPFQGPEEGLRATDLGKVPERKQRELTSSYKLCQNPC